VTYDSTRDTYAHITEVRKRLLQVVADLIQRATDHDKSKLEPPEKAIFDEFTPKLRDVTYGSDEYKGFLAAMGEGLAHHYKVNDHHPEHFENGVWDMDLIQVLEMLADWKAATMRHADGDLKRSIQENSIRFGYGAGFQSLLMNTARRMGWLD
jgi:hypothetical protein